MRYLLLLFLALWTSIASGQTTILYLNGIGFEPEDKEKGPERINEILHDSGFGSKFDRANTRYSYKENPSAGAWDLAELQIQAINSGLALTIAKVATGGSADAQSPEYRRALGRLYAKKIAAGTGDDHAAIQIYSLIKELGQDIGRLVLEEGGNLIVVSHSQGNFLAEAVNAYIRHDRSTDQIAALDQRLRFVGVASVAASTPNGRYISLGEDKALDAHVISTASIENFDVLPRNADHCSATNLKCLRSLLKLDRYIHSFLEIYTKEIIDTPSGLSLAYLLARHISDSFDEITPTPPSLERVSVASDGTQGNGEVWLPSQSSNGRHVAFMSSSSNLVPDDTNGAMDVFVHDRQTRETARVSVASDGSQAQGGGNFDIKRPSISSDGRFVAFTSSAHNLVLGDTNGVADVFVHDRQTKQTTRVSVASDGSQANVLHPYGSRDPSISADGRFVAFTSSASNLVAAATNGYDHVYLHDRQTRITSLVSISSGGEAGNSSSIRPSISANGQVVAFESGANNLLGDPPSAVFESNILVHDRLSGITTRVDVPSSGDRTFQNANSSYASISADGRFVAFESGKTNLVANDANNQSDVFVHDRQTGITARVSVASNATEGNSDSSAAGISGDGRFVVFTSNASNLVQSDGNGMGDVYLHDRHGASTTRISVKANGSQSLGESFGASISTDGRSIAFVSVGDLVDTDTNGARDVYATGSFGP